MLAVKIMSRKLALDDVVTEFLLNTCRLCPQSRSRHDVHAAVHCGELATVLLDDKDSERVRIPLTTVKSESGGETLGLLWCRRMNHCIVRVT